MQQRVKLQSDSGPPAARRGQKTALLFGAGYTALALIPHLRARGYHIAATVRSPEKSAALEKAGIEVLPFGRAAPPSALTAVLRVLKRAEIVLSSAGPDLKTRETDPILAALLGGSRRRFASMAPKLRWAGYLSATSVYGDRGGQWAFEDEGLYPKTARGRARVEAELAWLETGWPVHIFRLAGIYGPQLRLGGYRAARNPLSRIKSGKARLVIKPGHIVNRIHVMDIASALLASMDDPDPARIYNIADGQPAPPQDVLRFGARLVGQPAPPAITQDDPALSAMARSFYLESKRVDISRARAELGFTPAFAGYRKGLLSLMQSGAAGEMWLAGHIDVAEKHLALTLKLLPDHIKASRAEAGCLRFDVVQDTNIPTRLHVVEGFRSVKDFDIHQIRSQSSPWFDAARFFTRDYVTSGV
jgi:nucleoside-diphosphate-sugar epimerase/quinol monooxygenase YgiN